AESCAWFPPHGEALGAYSDSWRVGPPADGFVAATRVSSSPSAASRRRATVSCRISVLPSAMRQGRMRRERGAGGGVVTEGGGPGGRDDPAPAPTARPWAAAL